MADKKTLLIYNINTGEKMEIPSSHKQNYIGKGYTLTKPREKKES